MGFLYPDRQKKLEHNKPDITVVNKKSQTTLLIDPACPFDFRIESKEQQKLHYYNPLKFEIATLWKQKKSDCYTNCYWSFRYSVKEIRILGANDWC